MLCCGCRNVPSVLLRCLRRPSWTWMRTLTWTSSARTWWMWSTPGPTAPRFLRYAKWQTCLKVLVYFEHISHNKFIYRIFTIFNIDLIEASCFFTPKQIELFARVDFIQSQCKDMNRCKFVPSNANYVNWAMRLLRTSNICLFCTSWKMSTWVKNSHDVLQNESAKSLLACPVWHVRLHYAIVFFHASDVKNVLQVI